MNVLEKLFSAIRTSQSQRMKRFGVSEVLKQIHEYPDEIVLILQNIYDFLRNEDSGLRECGRIILESLEMFEYDIEVGDGGIKGKSDFVYLQTMDEIREVPKLEKSDQKRLIRKKLKLDHADDKFIEKLGADEVAPVSFFKTTERIQKEVNGVEDFFDALKKMLLSPDWHERHGGFLGLQAIFKKKKRTRSAQYVVEIKGDLLGRVFEILYNDKFNDFQDNRTSAPVREAAAKLLGLMYPYIKGREVIDQLIEYVEDTDWQVQFSGLLGLIELSDSLMGEEGLKREELMGLSRRVYSLSRGPDEDIKYLGAEILGYFIKRECLDEDFVKEVGEGVWDEIREDNEIDHSKASMIVLLTGMYKHYRKALPAPESFESLCPCFTSTFRVVRESMLDFCKFFNSEELLYMLCESILLSQDPEYLKKGVKVLEEIYKENKDLNAHFFRIITSSPYKPYNKDDFGCYEEAFFTRDGIQSLGFETIIGNRARLYSVLNCGNVEHKPKTLFGRSISGLESISRGERGEESLEGVCRRMLPFYSELVPQLRRVPINELESVFCDFSYTSIIPLCDNYILDYIRLVLVEMRDTVSNPLLYFARETCSPMVRLVCTRLLSSLSLPSVIYSVYRAAVEESLKDKASSLVTQNCTIFFEILGNRLFEDHREVLERILGDPRRLLFFRTTIGLYSGTAPYSVLDELFDQAVSKKEISVVCKMVGRMRYGERFVRKMLEEFDLEFYEAVLEDLEPSFSVLFVRALLRDISNSRGLLSKVLPSLYFLPPPEVPKDLAKRIDEEREELGMLIDPQGIPEYRVECSCFCELRDYQRDGIRWMAFLNRFHLNGILADDMGLGKTVQMLTYMISEMSKSQGAASVERSLVLCPSALTTHWVDEAHRFYGVTATLYTTKSTLPKEGLIVASYDTLRRDTGPLGVAKWFMVVFDEGHILRNRSTVLYQRASSLSFSRAFVLTGTPVHNSVNDLFSLFNLVLPGYLGSESEFSSLYACKVSDKNVDLMEERLSSLQRKTLPFILRRLKSEVLKDLPPKIIKDVVVDLSEAHRKLYDRAASGVANDSEDLSYSTSYGFEKTRKLLKVVSHPRYVTDKPEALASVAKIAALRDIFTVCEGRKLLVFFQMRQTIDFVIQDLAITDYMRIDSSLSGEQRGDIAKRFNSGTTPYLFMTTSCGGLGLNLTAADTVVFYEHDWNPFNDLQAMDRAHRLGQKRVVNVFRLIARDTIEEKVMSYQKFKLFVADSLVSQQNTDVERMDTKNLLERFL